MLGRARGTRLGGEGARGIQPAGHQADGLPEVPYSRGSGGPGRLDGCRLLEEAASTALHRRVMHARRHGGACKRHKCTGGPDIAAAGHREEEKWPGYSARVGAWRVLGAYFPPRPSSKPYPPDDPTTQRLKSISLLHATGARGPPPAPPSRARCNRRTCCVWLAGADSRGLYASRPSPPHGRAGSRCRRADQRARWGWWDSKSFASSRAPTCDESGRSLPCMPSTPEPVCLCPRFNTSSYSRDRTLFHFVQVSVNAWSLTILHRPKCRVWLGGGLSRGWQRPTVDLKWPTSHTSGRAGLPREPTGRHIAPQGQGPR